MKIYYSASNNAFYQSGVSYENEPSDLIEITLETWTSLLTGQASGRVVAASSDGSPHLTDRPEPTREEYAAMAVSKKIQLLAEAESKIAPLEYAYKLGIATDGELKARSAWQNYSVGINRTDTTDAPDISWPEKPQ